jgi:6-carboxyhexanoate--CoA ligase
VSASSELLHSVRMRAADAGGRHLCGAERIVTEGEVAATSQVLWRRARKCGAVERDIVLTVDTLAASEVERIPCLPLLLRPPQYPYEAMACAQDLLGACGVSRPVFLAALQGMTSGFAPGGGPLRGAALVDAMTGKRLEADRRRGVRASHFDYSHLCRQGVEQELLAHGLTHFRTLEALAVASKVQWSGVLAEWCWSDEPGYEAGYLGLPELGYVRFPRFKPPGAAGGRVFFLAPGTRVGDLTQRLEERWTLIDGRLKVTSAGRSGELLSAWTAGRMGKLWTN